MTVPFDHYFEKSRRESLGSRRGVPKSSRASLRHQYTNGAHQRGAAGGRPLSDAFAPLHAERPGKVPPCLNPGPLKAAKGLESVFKE